MGLINQSSSMVQTLIYPTCSYSPDSAEAYGPIARQEALNGALHITKEPKLATCTTYKQYSGTP